MSRVLSCRPRLTRFFSSANDVPEQLVIDRRALQAQDLFLQCPGWRDDVDARLEPALNVAGQLIHAGVRVHRHAQAEVRVRLHFDGRDGALDVAAVVHQRRQRRPRPFGHAIAFVEHGDAPRTIADTTLEAW